MLSFLIWDYLHLTAQTRETYFNLFFSRQNIKHAGLNNLQNNLNKAKVTNDRSVKGVRICRQETPAGGCLCLCLFIDYLLQIIDTFLD